MSILTKFRLLSASGVINRINGIQRSFASAKEPQRTALYDFHIKHGGKMVDFGGYYLPVQYADQSLIDSHLHTRSKASIFDVSHMLQTYVRGKDSVECFESICTADIRGAADGSGSLTVFTNESGGILDDLIVTKVNDELLYVVSNAAMKAQDMEIMQSAVSKFTAKGKDVSIEFLSHNDQSLIAVQGPKAVATLSKLLPNQKLLENLYFMTTTVSDIAGVNGCRITRCGYTGEDGVEISIPSEKVAHITEALLNAANDGTMKLAGLGARDSLRLEAGMCLYGNDIDPSKTPIEAALAWLVAKRRRTEKNFPGAERILQQLQANKVDLRRIGLIMTSKQSAPARGGSELYVDGKKVGAITSGCPSPSLNKNIAMGYINDELRKPGTAIEVKVRNKFYSAEVTKMPFVKTNYYTKK